MKKKLACLMMMALLLSVAVSPSANNGKLPKCDPTQGPRERSPLQVSTQGPTQDPTQGRESFSRTAGVTTIQLNNSMDTPNIANGSMLLSTTLPEGATSINRLDLQVTDMTASMHWYGGHNIQAGKTSVITPAGSVTGRAQLIRNKNQRIQIRNAWWYMYRSDVGGSGEQPICVHIRNATGPPGDLPAVECLANVTGNLSDYSSAVSRWAAFNFSAPLLNTSGNFWLVANASKLGVDKWGLWFQSTDPVPGRMASYASPSWSSQSANDMLCFVQGVRLVLDRSNETWAGSPESANLTAVTDGTTKVFGSSDTVSITSASAKAGSVEVSLRSNQSALVSVTYTWVYSYPPEEPRGPTGPTEDEEKGRYPDHLDDPEPWAPDPWPATPAEWFFGYFGWYCYWLVVICMFVVIFGFAAAPHISSWSWVIGANLIGGVVTMWVLMAYLAPDLLARATRDQDAIATYYLPEVRK